VNLAEGSDMNINSECSVGCVTAPPRGRVMQTVAGWVTVIVAGLKAFGPYAAIELLLPGGSLMALGLWFFQRRLRKGAAVTDRGAA
jgi:hypothetical protein